jgi:hypothetical protein
VTRRAAFLLAGALTLAACSRERADDVVVLEMPWDGSTLGVTYPSTDDDFIAFIWLASILPTEPDVDLARRVCVHELEHAFVLYDQGPFADEAPPGFGPGWYLFDADTLEPFAVVPEAEARWLSEQHRLGVRIEGPAWLLDAVTAAAETINDAAGAEIVGVDRP